VRPDTAARSPKPQRGGTTGPGRRRSWELREHGRARATVTFASAAAAAGISRPGSISSSTSATRSANCETLPAARLVLSPPTSGKRRRPAPPAHRRPPAQPGARRGKHPAPPPVRPRARRPAIIPHPMR